MLGWYEERMGPIETGFWKGWHLDGTLWKSFSKREVGYHPDECTEGVQNIFLEMTSGLVHWGHQGSWGDKLMNQVGRESWE